MDRLTIYSVLSLLLSGMLLGCSAPTIEEIYEPMQYKLQMPEKPVNGSIYSNYSYDALFEDARAGRIGDIIIVQLQESTSGTKSANTNITKDTENSVSNPILADSLRDQVGNSSLQFDLQSEHAFSGAGDSNQSNSLSGTIAVTVVGILPNGNLVVDGEKWMQINRGREYVRLRGMIRPFDVSNNNTISSTRVANAEIQYGGKGDLAQANTPGWLSRFFVSPIWPF